MEESKSEAWRLWEVIERNGDTLGEIVESFYAHAFKSGTEHSDWGPMLASHTDVRMAEGMVAIQSGDTVSVFKDGRPNPAESLGARELLVAEVDLKLALDAVRAAIANNVRPLP